MLKRLGLCVPLLLVASCGGSGDPTSDASTSASGGSAQAGAGGGSSGASGATGGSGGGAAGGTAMTDPYSLCTSYGVFLSGPAATGMFPSSSGDSGHDVDSWHFAVSLGDTAMPGAAANDGMIVLEGSGVPSTPAWSPIEHGLLRARGPNGTGVWTCVGGGSFRDAPEGQAFRMQDLSTLGACPGAPVDGEIALCMDDGYGPAAALTAASCLKGATHVVGTYGGHAVEAMPVSFGGGASAAGDVVRSAFYSFHGGGVLWLDGLSQNQTEPHGALMLPGGDLVCIGAGSEGHLGDHDLQVVLRGLSVVGACPGVAQDGEQLGCVR